MLEIEKEKLELQKQQAAQISKDRESEATKSKTAGQARAKAKLAAFQADYDCLVPNLNEGQSDVTNMSDQEICDAMQNLAKTEKIVDRLIRNFLDFEQLSLSIDFLFDSIDPQCFLLC